MFFLHPDEYFWACDCCRWIYKPVVGNNVPKGKHNNKMFCKHTFEAFFDNCFCKSTKYFDHKYVVKLG